jgi:hypothetical protein
MTAQILPGLEAFLEPKKEDLFAKWDQTTEKEKRSRTLFAQETIKVEEVSRELAAVQLHRQFRAIRGRPRSLIQAAAGDREQTGRGIFDRGVSRYKVLAS